MNDNSTPELTDQQIELAKAFNQATKLFVNNLREEYRTKVNKDRFGPGQIISKISNLAAEEIDEITQSHGYKELEIVNLIKGALQGSSREIENAETEDDQQKMLDFCKNNILKSLFLSAYAKGIFPKSIFIEDHPDFDRPKFTALELKYF